MDEVRDENTRESSVFRIFRHQVVYPIMCPIKKGFQFLILKPLSVLAPLTAQFSNLLFEDFKKIYELKPFINVDSLSTQ